MTSLEFDDQLGADAPPMERIMTTSSHDLVDDLFAPLLRNSEKYDRGVGYFSSGWMRENAKGMAAFAERGGHARWITSPILSGADINAIAEGHDAQHDDLLRKKLETAIDDLEKQLGSDTLKTIAWLIADGVLELRLAIPRNKLAGEFHDKFGIFDLGNDRRVAFSGSYNDSIQGLRNYESLKIFDWRRPDDDEVIDFEQNRFDALWENEDANVAVIPFPAAQRERLLKLRGESRPYKLPESYKPPHVGAEPLYEIPSWITLRPYQKEAIQAWLDAGGKGLLEMATGAGKTITALSLIAQLAASFQEKRRPLTILVACPYQHLVTQWNKEAKQFGFHPTLCMDDSQVWAKKLAFEQSSQATGARPVLMLITTFKGLQSKRMSEFLGNVSGTTIVVGDEAHGLGADQSAVSLPTFAKYRLGLSATPERHLDDEGTERIRDYFGESVFSLPLEEAIGKYLTPYEYHPVLVDLDDDELGEYHDITRKLARMVHDEDDFRKNEQVKRLLIRRSRLIAVARGKLTALDRAIEESGETSHMLVYCGDGRVDENLDGDEVRQIENVTRRLGSEAGYKVRTFTADTPSIDREQIKSDLGSGRIQAVVAIRCLDEGVDIPETKTAFILASSSNPRQWVQRRGRVLRKSEGKDRARIWDFIVVPPPDSLDDASFNIERQLVKKELLRVREFADASVNGPLARQLLAPLMRRFNLLDV